jgi:hypothetical protein
MFDPDSRYVKLPQYTVTDAQGRSAQVLVPRLLDSPAAALSHTVDQSDRPDLIAYRYYREPELFWRVADCNEVMRPAELVESPGKRIGIPPRE